MAKAHASIRKAVGDMPGHMMLKTNLGQLLAKEHGLQRHDREAFFEQALDGPDQYLVVGENPMWMCLDKVAADKAVAEKEVAAKSVTDKTTADIDEPQDGGETK